MPHALASPKARFSGAVFINRWFITLSAYQQPCKVKDANRMAQLTEKDKQFLLRKARRAVVKALTGKVPGELSTTASPAVDEQRGCFVTLHKAGELRGCIGTLEPTEPLRIAVANNACNAAFHDPRFPPVKAPELDDLDFEISVLSVPQVLAFKDRQDLLRQLKPGVHGVILIRDGRRATFLPQVWEQLPDTVAFLQHLCLKGGMAKDCWQDPRTEVKVYQADYFAELDFHTTTP
jgi:AmmeMemoRadiSam system protein A